MPKTFFLSVLLLGFCTLKTTGQQAKRDLQVGYNFGIGKMLKIASTFPYREKTVYHNFTFSKRLCGEKYWHSFFNFPTIGLTASYANFGNNTVLGQGVSLLPHIGNSKKITDRFAIKWSYGIGLAYFNKPHNVFTNPENIVIGTSVTAIVGGEIGASFQINDYLSTNINVGLRHYSDAHFSVPNVGANIPHTSLGLKYTLKKQDKNTPAPLALEAKKSISVKLEAGMGWHETEGTFSPSNGPLYPVYFLEGSLVKRGHKKHAFLLGFQWAYYSDYHDFIINQQIFLDNEKKKAQKMYVFLGREVFFGKFSFYTHAGFNVYFPFSKALVEEGYSEPDFENQHLSHKVGFKYYWKDLQQEESWSPYINIGIQTLGFKADYLLLAIGFEL